MAHWAKIDENNVVVSVVVTDNDAPNEGHDWLVANLGGTWLKTSYNPRAGVYITPNSSPPVADDDQSKAYRGNYAGKGFTYDADLDAFIPPQPFPSWTLNETTYQWDAPSEQPDDDHVWDEDSLAWVPLVPNDVTENS